MRLLSLPLFVLSVSASCSSSFRFHSAFANAHKALDSVKGKLKELQHTSAELEQQLTDQNENSMKAQREALRELRSLELSPYLFCLCLFLPVGLSLFVALVCLSVFVALTLHFFFEPTQPQGKHAEDVAELEKKYDELQKEHVKVVVRATR